LFADSERFKDKQTTRADGKPSARNYFSFPDATVSTRQVNTIYNIYVVNGERVNYRFQSAI